MPTRQSTQNAFNPAISLILDGTYGKFQQDPTQYSITGFQPPGATSPGDRSFSLGESELFITANADHVFMGALNLSLHGDDTVSVEEAYFQTIALGHGLVLKGGRSSRVLAIRTPSTPTPGTSSIPPLSNALFWATTTATMACS